MMGIVEDGKDRYYIGVYAKDKDNRIIRVEISKEGIGLIEDFEFVNYSLRTKEQILKDEAFKYGDIVAIYY